MISTVNCSATVSRYVAEHFNRDGGLDGFDNIDGVVALTHGGGCAINTKGEGFKLLQRTIWGFANNPNFGGVVVIGLGCETNQIPWLMKRYGIAETPTFRTMTIQETGGTQKTIRRAVEFITAMLPEVNALERSEVPVSELVLALQCGGSDGYSGISANPALGAAADLLVRHGGTAILSETPEIYGVEHTLTSRARSREVGERLVQRIRWWKEEYSPGRDVQINGKVSPGNQMGGLANIFEKSLGSSMKGGTTALMEVYRYAEPVRQPGMVFMDTPGFDPVSATGQIAGGANMICFTTGRGSMFGAKPVPSLKLATNTPMYERLTEDMDVNCGDILDGTATLQEVAQRIFEEILRVASGARSKSELLGLGDHEFVPWNIGVVS